MTDTSRAYFDTFMGMAGGSGQRARDFAGKVREDLRAGAEKLRGDVKSGSEQVRDHGSRTFTDIGRLIRAEMDAGLARCGVATQNDLDDLNLRLDTAEAEIHELRQQLAEAEARAARAGETPAPAPTAEAGETASEWTAEGPSDEESR